ncbi:MAG: 16S rRNA (cytidine(1402)-2'-O)-methyltransferase [Bacteroidetes bacterium]|nr:16S rRNA (cytidine(1402)-2'-O)-methyltransferase [Bacteroidota bacterium]
MSGTLYLISTPIGNLEDMSFRAIRILKSLDALGCEDTRITRRLLQHYEIEQPSEIFSYHEHNEERAVSRILDMLEQGKQVGLVSDAGNPSISDPGFRAAQSVSDAGYTIEVIPGPSAVNTALLLSGLPTSSFTFKGFPPKKGGQRKRFLEPEAELPHSLIFFESKFRTASFLKSALDVLGDRKAAVCIELTKKFERVRRGYLTELIDYFEGKNIKGEVTIVIAGNHPKFIREEEVEA